MDFGQLVGAAFRLYIGNWKRFMAIVAVVVIPVSFAQRVLLGPIQNSFRFGIHPRPLSIDPWSFALRLLVALLISLVVGAFMQGAMVRAVIMAHLGFLPSISETYRFALSRVPSLLLVVVLSGLVTGLGFALLIVPGIILVFRLLFAPAAVVVERAKGRSALWRSWRLTKGHFWRIVGTVLFASVVAGGVGAIVSLPVFIVRGVFAGWAARAILQSIGSIVATPYTSAVSVLLYLDLRVRKEGLDPSLLPEQMS